VQAAPAWSAASPSESGSICSSHQCAGTAATEEEFGEIIVKNGTNGEVTRLARHRPDRTGAADYSLRSLLDNKSAVAVPIFQSRAPNAIRFGQRPQDDGRAEAEHARRPGLQHRLRSDAIVRDPSKRSVHTLLEAVALVVLVVILFLQTWSASIIPLIAGAGFHHRHLPR